MIKAECISPTQSLLLTFWYEARVIEFKVDYSNEPDRLCMLGLTQMFALE